MSPKIEPSIGGEIGTIKECDALSGVPIGAILGDHHADTFGQVCFNLGDAKCTFGTGAFIMMNMVPANSKPIISSQGLLTTPFYQIKGQPVQYALEGAVSVAGSLIQWLRDNLNFGLSAKEIAELSASVPSFEGVRFVPAFNGLFAPHWRQDARGVICGLTFYHTKAHIARAAIEAAGFHAAEVFDAIEIDSGIKLLSLKVDGGMVANPELIQSTAAGVAFAAGLSSGVWKSLDEINDLREESITVDSKISWKRAIDRSLGWER